jgi:hypothetical protein
LIVPDNLTTKTAEQLVHEIRNLLPVIAASDGRWGGSSRARDRVDLMLDLLLESTAKPGATVGPEVIRYQWRQRTSGGFTEWVDCGAEFFHRLQGKSIERRTLGVIQEPKP